MLRVISLQLCNCVIKQSGKSWHDEGNVPKGACWYAPPHQSIASPLRYAALKQHGREGSKTWTGAGAMTSKVSPAVDDTGVFASLLLPLFHCRFPCTAACVLICVSVFFAFCEIVATATLSETDESCSLRRRRVIRRGPFPCNGRPSASLGLLEAPEVAEPLSVLRRLEQDPIFRRGAVVGVNQALPFVAVVTWPFVIARRPSSSRVRGRLVRRGARGSNRPFARIEAPPWLPVKRGASKQWSVSGALFMAALPVCLF